MTLIRSLTRDTFDTETGNARGLVVLDYWAPWCAPCRALLPVLEELAGEFSGKTTFLKLNVDEDPQRAVAHGVRGVPTLVFLKNGVEVDRVVGIESHSNLRKRISGHLVPAKKAGSV